MKKAKNLKNPRNRFCIKSSIKEHYAYDYVKLQTLLVKE